MRSRFAFVAPPESLAVRVERANSASSDRLERRPGPLLVPMRRWTEASMIAPVDVIQHPRTCTASLPPRLRVELRFRCAAAILVRDCQVTVCLVARAPPSLRPGPSSRKSLGQAALGQVSPGAKSRVSSNFNLATIPGLCGGRRITSSSNPTLTDPVEDHVQQPC